ncbi:hypothetical protein DJ71_19445 [Halorubrum sp. E3]|nr:hypothetical protein DJ71_19445 [Halorubrum sp. E3]
MNWLTDSTSVLSALGNRLTRQSNLTVLLNTTLISASGVALSFTLILSKASKMKGDQTQMMRVFPNQTPWKST